MTRKRTACGPVVGHQSIGLPGPLKRSAVKVLFLSALVAIARAQSPVEPTPSFHPDVLLNLPYSARLELDLRSLPGWSARMASAVLTSDYRLRMLEERAQLQNRYGVSATDPETLGSSLVHQTATGHPQLNFIQELRFPGGRPLAGLQFERKDVLFKGDHLGVRSTSDIQALARGVGLSATQSQADVLSLLGWRSHSRLEWQLGDPTRELQWRLSAGVDRRATTQKSGVNLQLLRRF